MKVKIDNLPKENYMLLGDLWSDDNSNINKIESTMKWLIEYQSLRVDNQDDKILRKYILNEESLPKNTEDLFKVVLKKIDIVNKTKTTQINNPKRNLNIFG